MFLDNIDHIQLTDGDFKLFRDYIHENCGIYFEDNKMYLLQNRLSRRLTELGIKSFRDYYYHVKYDNSRQEFYNLMNIVTTNETSFFRNETQLDSFADFILPKVIDEKRIEGHKTLKLWSAGCSTGDEPYSLAIILLDKLKSSNYFDIQIYANDINQKVLKSAREGKYHKSRLVNVNNEYLKRYFTFDGENYQVCKEIKNLVKFTQMNLNDHNQFVLIHNMDFIFCRNVMIYFSSEAKKKLIRNFYDTLNPGGYLFLGLSESLHGISKAFKLKFYNNCLTYQKEKHVRINLDTTQKIYEQEICNIN